MAWEHLTDYLKGSLNSLGRALNIHLNNNLNGGRNVEDPATFERWKAELAASISIRQMDSSANRPFFCNAKRNLLFMIHPPVLQ